MQLAISQNCTRIHVIALPHCDIHEYYSSSTLCTYRLSFCLLILELSFLTAETHIHVDTSEEEGSSLMTSMKPSLSMHLHNAMVGYDASYPFKDLCVAGLVLQLL